MNIEEPVGDSLHPVSMNAQDSFSHLISGIRIATALVFLFAAVSKVIDVPLFIDELVHLGWIPVNLISLSAGLLIIGEFVTALLLLSNVNVSLGATFAWFLSTIFLMVTSVKIVMRTPNACPCFGVFLKLNPFVMVGIDLLMLLSSLLLMNSITRQRRSESPLINESIPDSSDYAIQGVSVFRPNQKMFFCVALYVTGAAVALCLGFIREQNLAEDIHVTHMTLHYGDAAPDFQLTSTSGASLTLKNLRKWKLIIFFAPGCEACEQELQDIPNLNKALKSQVETVPVVVGKPLVGDPINAARRFQQRLNLSISLAVDPDGKVNRLYNDQPAAYPFNVLLDPQARVRYIQTGAILEGETLLSRISSFVNARPIDAIALATMSHSFGEKAPDGDLTIEGRKIKLSSLWKSKPLLLSFFLKGCSGCEDQQQLLERTLGGTKAIRRVYIFPSSQDVLEEKKTLDTQATFASDESTDLHTRFQVWYAPQTYLIKDGRLIYSTGNRKDEDIMQRLFSHPHAILALDTTKIFPLSRSERKKWVFPSDASEDERR